MGRRSFIAGTVAGVAALVVSLGPVHAGAQPEAAAALAVVVDGVDYRLALSDHGGGAYVARLTTSDGAAAPGARISFALVGVGRLAGPALCVTPASGECVIEATGSGANGAVLAAGFGGTAVTVPVGSGS